MTHPLQALAAVDREIANVARDMDQSGEPPWEDLERLFNRRASLLDQLAERDRGGERSSGVCLLCNHCHGPYPTTKCGHEGCGCWPGMDAERASARLEEIRRAVPEDREAGGGDGKWRHWMGIAAAEREKAHEERARAEQAEARAEEAESNRDAAVSRLREAEARTALAKRALADITHDRDGLVARLRADLERAERERDEHFDGTLRACADTAKEQVRVVGLRSELNEANDELERARGALEGYYREHMPVNGSECCCDLCEAARRAMPTLPRSRRAEPVRDAEELPEGVMPLCSICKARHPLCVPCPDEAPAPYAEERDTFDLIGHLHRQRAWSLRTFGDGYHYARVLAHIEKELAEIRAMPQDIVEWIDVVLLALDGAWRAGAEPEAIAATLAAKQAKNEAREWPPPTSSDVPVEHVRDPAPRPQQEAREEAWRAMVGALERIAGSPDAERCGVRAALALARNVEEGRDA